MRGRVARALEELAKAVRQSSDDEWEVVEAEVAEVVKSGGTPACGGEIFAGA